MNKKILISLSIILSLVFSISVCLANDGIKNAANDVRNVVGGVENTVENAAKDVSNASKGATGTIENDINNRNNNRYDASRVSTENNGNFMGMSSNGWIWLVLGIVALLIIALVWYYSMQFTNNNRHDNNNNRLD